jgi:urease accessory protein
MTITAIRTDPAAARPLGYGHWAWRPSEAEASSAARGEGREGHGSSPSDEVRAFGLAADVSPTLFAWFSPAFPTGGFAYSHGLETAAREGRVIGEAGLGAWLQGVLTRGSGWNDAVLLSLAHRADDEALAELAALAAALAPSRERLAETLGQGEAFLTAVRAGWPQLAPCVLPGRLAYPVVAGAAAARLGASAQMTLGAYLTGFCANLIAAGVRLSLCGQSGGVRILARLTPLIGEIAARAANAAHEDLGGCALGADIASLRHETLNGRLFLS